jgi:hypothetical protein
MFLFCSEAMTRLPTKRGYIADWGQCMSDRLERMRRNPVGDWNIRDVEAVCREYAVLCEPARGGGSHYKVAHARMAEKLTIPYKRPIKPVYIRKLVAFIDAVRKQQ